MKKRFVAALAITVFLFPTISFSQSWQFIGPDSVLWRNVVQMDVHFRQGAPPRIGIGTTAGVAANLGDGWRYVLRNFLDHPITDDFYYRAVYFSPWNDSVAFVGEDRIAAVFNEPGSFGGTVRNVFSTYWSVAQHGSGGWVGHSPSLSFAFSPHRSGKVYSWIVDLYKTTSNGTSWQGAPGTSYGCFFLNADQKADSVLYAWVRPSSGNHGIYRSVNDGFTWNLVKPFQSPGIYPHPYSDFFANGDTLIHATSWFPQNPDSLSGIFISTDYGITWSQPVRNINVQKMTRDARLPNQFFAAAQGGIYRSTTTGLTWQLFSDSLPSMNLVDIRKDPYSDTLYLATSDLGVYKMFPLATTVHALLPVPISFSLYQNYPNPFNPSTIIKFQTPQSGILTLAVYDVLGREVAMILSGPFSAGAHEVSFNAENLTSGIYFYRLKSNGFSFTRKMVLMK